MKRPNDGSLSPTGRLSPTQPSAEWRPWLLAGPSGTDFTLAPRGFTYPPPAPPSFDDPCDAEEDGGNADGATAAAAEAGGAAAEADAATLMGRVGSLVARSGPVGVLDEPGEWLMPRQPGSWWTRMSPWMTAAALLELWEAVLPLAFATPPDVMFQLHALLGQCAACLRGQSRPTLMARGARIYYCDSQLQCMRCSQTLLARYDKADRVQTRVWREVSSEEADALRAHTFALTAFPAANPGVLDRLADGMPLRDLRVMAASLLPRVVRWAGRGTELRRLVLRSLQLTSHHLLLLRPLARRLEVLDVAYNDELASLADIAEHLCALKELDLSNCPNLMRNVRSWLPQLAAHGQLRTLIAWSAMADPRVCFASLRVPSLRRLEIGPTFSTEDTFQIAPSHVAGLPRLEQLFTTFSVSTDVAGLFNVFATGSGAKAGVDFCCQLRYPWMRAMRDFDMWYGLSITHTKPDSGAQLLSEECPPWLYGLEGIERARSDVSMRRKYDQLVRIVNYRVRSESKGPESSFFARYSSDSLSAAGLPSSSSS